MSIFLKRLASKRPISINSSVLLIVGIGSGIAGYVAGSDDQAFEQQMLAHQEVVKSEQLKRGELELALEKAKEQTETLRVAYQSEVKETEKAQKALQKIRQQVQVQQQSQKAALAHSRKQLEDKNKAVALLKQRILDAEALYAERHKTMTSLGALNQEVVNSRHQVDTTAAACDEYKQGNSWNLVSQKDCDAHAEAEENSEELMRQYNELSKSLDEINIRLSAFGAMSEAVSPDTVSQ